MSETDANRAQELREMRSLAKRVIEHHFGSPPRRIEHKTGGLSNYVFTVAHPAGRFVVRISPDAAKLNTFIKEQWAVAKARSVDVPTPEILEVGNDVIPHPYMISVEVMGEEATHHPRRAEILGEMGRLAERINSIATRGYGNVFDWSGNQLSRNDSWQAWLAGEYGLEARLETLAEHGGFSARRLAELRSILEEADSAQRPALNHGDLRWKNVMIGRGGAIVAVIDWEHCVSNLAPQWELSVALHDLSIDEKQTFLEGYGISAVRFAAMAPLVKAINILNYAPHLGRLAQRGEIHSVERLRERFSGVLDLYTP